MRLFIGIPLENAAQEKLTGIYDKLEGFKTVKKENLHITLQFLGDMEEASIEILKKAVDSACEGFARFEITCSRLSAFPHTRNAKIAWANVDKGNGAIKKLFKNIEKNLQAVKYEREKRAFIPHITLGRSKSGVDIYAAAVAERFEVASTARSVVLYSSAAEEAGLRYEKLYERQLAPEKEIK